MNQLIELNTQSFFSWFTNQVSSLSFISFFLLWEWFATLNSHHASVRISIKKHERLSELHHIFQIVQAYTLDVDLLQYSELFQLSVINLFLWSKRMNVYTLQKHFIFHLKACNFMMSIIILCLLFCYSFS